MILATPRAEEVLWYIVIYILATERSNMGQLSPAIEQIVYLQIDLNGNTTSMNDHARSTT